MHILGVRAYGKEVVYNGVLQGLILGILAGVWIHDLRGTGSYIWYAIWVTASDELHLLSISGHWDGIHSSPP
jgi:hypothetical protein